MTKLSKTGQKCSNLPQISTKNVFQTFFKDILELIKKVLKNVSGPLGQWHAVKELYPMWIFSKKGHTALWMSIELMKKNDFRNFINLVRMMPQKIFFSWKLDWNFLENFNLCFVWCIYFLLFCTQTVRTALI